MLKLFVPYGFFLNNFSLTLWSVIFCFVLKEIGFITYKRIQIIARERARDREKEREKNQKKSMEVKKKTRKEISTLR